MAQSGCQNELGIVIAYAILSIHHRARRIQKVGCISMEKEETLVNNMFAASHGSMEHSH